jgi:LysM repeat protein
MLIDHFMIRQQPYDLESFKPMEEKVEAPVQPKATQPEAEVPETPAQPAEAEPAETLDPYAAKDARVRLGAWRIVGTDQVVKVREGQTLKRLSKFYLGPDMECYVEVYNNLSPNAELKVGQEIKIPKLVHKKSLKKQ